jgi:hypothetical protein
VTGANLSLAFGGYSSGDPPRSTEISEEKDAGGDTWLTELLQRASREEDEAYQDFAPKRASNRNVYPG